MIKPAFAGSRRLGAAGTSLANVKELILPLLDAAQARTVVEVGAFRGELTAELLDWGAVTGAHVAAVDPDPPAELEELAVAHPELELIREMSQEALARIAIPEAVIIDGDHNYYTVSRELQLIHERTDSADGPIVMFHDVGWPLGRRDTYHAPELIPEEYRQPLPHDIGLSPEPDFTDDRPFAHTAEQEGGPRNGGLTAIEDFMAGHPGLRLALVSAFFGFGVLWREDARWADAVVAVVGPFDRNLVVDRLEADRLAHLLASQVRAREAATLQSQVEDLQHRIERQEDMLRSLLGSNAFAMAEHISRLRRRGRPAISRDGVRQALGR
jgi:hypothetical protein